MDQLHSRARSAFWPAAAHLVPLIFRLPVRFQASTTLSEDPYVWHWLAVTGALFLLSAVAFALRLRTASRIARPALTPEEDSEAEHRAAEPATAAGDCGRDDHKVPPTPQPPAGEDRTRPARPAIGQAVTQMTAQGLMTKASETRPAPR
jgi:hypothetical protein